jgi:hypothetical protein
LITINGVLKKKNTKSKFDPIGLKTGAFEDGFGVKKSASKGNLHVAHDGKVFFY